MPVFMLTIILLTLISGAFYLTRHKHFPKLNSRYSQHVGAWYFVKWCLLTLFLWVVKLVRQTLRRRRGCAVEIEQEKVGSPIFFASDRLGNVVMAQLRRRIMNEKQFAEVQVLLHLADGRTLTHILSPECLAADETPFGDESDDSYVAAGGLRVQTVNPCMTYRLIYCGLMRRIDLEDTPRLGHVNLRLWFRSLSDPANFAIDYCPSLFAASIANEPNSINILKQFLQSTDVHVEQSGELRGFVEINEEPRLELTLNGLRDSVANVAKLDEDGFFKLRARFENGLVVSLAARSWPDFISHQIDGFVTFPTGFIYPVTWSDLHLAHVSNDELPNNLTVNLSAHGRMFSLVIENLSSTHSRVIDEHWQAHAALKVNIVKIQLSSDQNENTEFGYGIIEFSNDAKREDLPSAHWEIIDKLQTLTKVARPPEKPLGKVQNCLQLSDPLCRLSSVTGGKAAKLADIVAAITLKNLDETQLELRVPDGFAITVSAYESHLNANPHLAELIKQTLALANSTSELESASQRLKDAFLATPLSPHLVRDIETAMRESFNGEEVILAVRSSAVGEDGSEASGAGQMETFLGIRGITQVIDSIKQCWASHYSYRAIGYRRQLCAKLDSPMAVLVQRLVKADVAGVLFTRHPDNGSTSKMVINASYGIGESVVSGSVQPDTITVEHERGNILKIVYNVLGEKATAFKLDENEMAVTVEQTASTSSSTSCCMTEDEIGRLVRVGLFIERIFGCGRDVEFALVNDSSSVSILQARPITTADMEMEWELMHEFDSPLAGDRECLTTANLQEMMPGALAPLSSRIWLAMTGEGLEVPVFETMAPFPLTAQHGSQLSTCFHELHTLLFPQQNFCAPATSEQRKLSFDISLFGRRIDHLSVEMLTSLNDVTDLRWQLYLTATQIKRFLLPPNGMLTEARKIQHFQPPRSREPAVLFEEIQQNLMPLVQSVWSEYIVVNFGAGSLPNLIRQTLEPSMCWGHQIHADMAKLLSSCENVFSADVPTQLQALANSIRQDPIAKDAIAKMNRVEMTKWLMTSPKHGKLFKTFLRKHGHRCVRESDIRERSWSEEPEKLIDALKILIEAENLPEEKKEKREILSVTEAIDAIETPINRLQRLMLRIVLPRARRYVGMREWAKSLGIKMADHCRRAYKRLAVLLVENGYLPDEDLIYFVDVHEIGSLLKRKSPKLIAKALRRRKLFSAFQNLKFEELVFGHPEPLRQQLNFASEGAIVIKGTAVGQGCVTGIARVVRSLAEANQIRSGDVLIVPFTDVGWTPYFPMLSGLVTELGGLISHGAVVAREYGLPCLVGCKNATELIKTGDKVVIDGQIGQVAVI